MDRERINHYIASHGKSLTRLCLKLCRNYNEVEDLYQETWCKAINKIHLYDEAKLFEPWLLTICVNTYKNLYRKNKNKPVAEFATNEEKDKAFDKATDTRFLFNEEHDYIRQIINGLEEKYRIVIILYYFEDYSITELASIIRIPQGTVKSRLYKAREIIKRRFEDSETFYDG